MAYKPEGSLTLDEQLAKPQIRLGIQGYPKTGKTHSAMTFPLPVVWNLDRGLGEFVGRPDITDIPIWNLEWRTAFCKRMTKYGLSINPQDIKTITLIWIQYEGVKLEQDQTFVCDGGTGLENAHTTWEKNNPTFSATGVEDFRAPWRHKIEFFTEFCALMKTLRCDVVYLMHESPVYDTKGDSTGKLRPLLTGQFKEQLASHFTHFFRQHAIEKPKDSVEREKLIKWSMMKPEEIDKLIASFPDSTTMYLWQTIPDDTFDGGATTPVKYPKFIKADFKTLLSYSKISST